MCQTQASAAAQLELPPAHRFAAFLVVFNVVLVPEAFGTQLQPPSAYV